MQFFDAAPIVRRLPGLRMMAAIEAAVRASHTIDVPGMPAGTLLLMPAWQVGNRIGAIALGDIAGDLRDLVRGKISGRTDDSQITVFKSVGLALEDLVAADAVYGAGDAGSHAEAATDMQRDPK